MEVIFAIIAIIVVALAFFVEDASAQTAGTSVAVMISAEVACTEFNADHSVTCIENNDQPVEAKIEASEEKSLWQKIVDIFLFW